MHTIKNRQHPLSQPFLVFRSGLLVLILVGGAWLEAKSSREPENLALLKDSIRIYVENGGYNADVEGISNSARGWIAQRTSLKATDERLALVLDIDDTALSNLPYMLRLDWGYESETWKSWLGSASCPAIAPIQSLYVFAKSRGVAVFFVTSRRENSRIKTEENLRNAGFSDFDGIYFRPEEPRQTPEFFKTACRRQIEERGYLIICNVGDQDSDLSGGYSEKIFKLPNPFYITK